MRQNVDNLSKYKGIIPAFYACYDERGEVSTERVRMLVRYFIEKGVKGIYVNGSSGECIYLSVSERKQILDAVMEEARNKLTVICHVACNNTKDSCELASHAENLGVDAIAAIPPIYFHLPEHAIAAYWNDISAAAPNTDFVIYNIPQLAGVSLTMPLFKTMLQNKRVIGVKNSSMPTQDIQMFKAEGGDNCVIFNGPDEQFVAGRAIGAEGGIGGTYGAMPELFLEIDRLINEEKIIEARNVQYKVNEIIYKMFETKGSAYAVIKEVLRINENLDIGCVRKPLPNLFEEDMIIVQEIAQMIRDAKKLFLLK